MRDSRITEAGARRCTELCLSLRNLSHALGDLARGDMACDQDSLICSLLSVQRLVDDAAGELRDMDRLCHACPDLGLAGGCPGAVVP